MKTQRLQAYFLTRPTILLSEDNILKETARNERGTQFFTYSGLEIARRLGAICAEALLNSAGAPKICGLPGAKNSPSALPSGPLDIHKGIACIDSASC